VIFQKNLNSNKIWFIPDATSARQLSQRDDFGDYDFILQIIDTGQRLDLRFIGHEFKKDTLPFAISIPNLPAPLMEPLYHSEAGLDDSFWHETLLKFFFAVVRPIGYAICAHAVRT
jgi:hypothetical protein